MKFNKYISPELEELLTAKYKEYIKKTVMTKKEMGALREWVKDGHNVYENTAEAWEDDQVPVEFLTVYRDEEDIRQQTKGMGPDETRTFGMAYYGWSDDEPVQSEGEIEERFELLFASEEELPFQKQKNPADFPRV